MDFEKVKRRQSLKVIISEAIMVIAVITTVTILAFLVSGYWINSDLKLERQGLLQISSIPTGASVYIDGDSSWFQNTNTSKVLPSGEHTITLTKEGYDSWSKTINIAEGLLYRLHYPRLFLNERTQENILATKDTKLATFSSDHNYLLLINESSKWTLVNLNNDNVKPTEFDISDVFNDIINANEKFPVDKILSIDWDYDSNHILLKLENNEYPEWALLDVKNPSKSINLTKEFSGNFSEIQILDNSSNNLLAIQNNNLQKIDIPSKSLSAVLVKDIITFDHYDNSEVIFSAKKPSNGNENSNENSNYYVGLLKLGDDKIINLQDTISPAKVTLSKFYDDQYITILVDDIVSVYKKEGFIKSFEYKLSFTPESLKVGHNGEFITMSSDNKIATLDMESMSIIEWTIENENFNWIDNDMISVTEENNLIVYDYDGLNRRVIANNALDNSPAAITNNKWLYYFTENNLVREVINN